MNKTDRLLAIVLELQRHKVMRAEDLAAAFETSVRTIYRDMQALSEAGVPIIGSTGQGYSLMEGYFLPPVSFTVEEAVTMLIGMDFIEQKFDSDYGAKARASRGKVEAILPENVRNEANRVRKSMRLLTSGKDAVKEQEKEYLERIRDAILEERKISFRYMKSAPEPDGNRQSSRVAEPYGLVLNQGAWMLVAHCELRQEIRHFRLSRMSELHVLECRFHVPSDFNLHDYKPSDDRDISITILANPDIADKVIESNNYFMTGTEEHPDGLLVKFRVRQPGDLLHWVLSWGAGVVVLEPESFRRRVRIEVENMLKRY
ncbi:YafY family transcriptional regulator [Paenibacillus sp. J5C_2022]|uniref:helix-turn-helix transcriptional regulator n=1 Tax=Paenibacillus sp. J5C2022 TaxID=2977129 RepID=UPI0021D25E2D|nr:YafY family protein [Paenibacillus sp. J5C2022]MCU6711906.1 YafY family transcriptional regulator [Paenibacillus sp. J5C2022]